MSKKTSWKGERGGAESKDTLAFSVFTFCPAASEAQAGTRSREDNRWQLIG